MNTLKSIGAVLAGMAVIIALSIGTDLAMEALFARPRETLFTPGMLGVALLYRCMYTVLGGYVAAALSPANPLRHVMILGIIGTVLCIIGMIAEWSAGTHWYPIALVITALPCTWLGGKWRTRV